MDKPCELCRRGTTGRRGFAQGQDPGWHRRGLRILGRRLPSPRPDTPAGDLHVVVRSSAHPDFLRRGADLWHVELIGEPASVLGTFLEVPTLDGRPAVIVPAGTRPGAVLWLKGTPPVRPEREWRPLHRPRGRSR